ncbi:cellulose binding domain-containing protein [Streptomyces sp. NPDC020965]|uniref:cellulose binding domain-containing protein n=1 Tax=Streptomyces sp. NPDC020965 TaxID=3365105 RepID=UPI0037A9EF0C
MRRPKASLIAIVMGFLALLLAPAAAASTPLALVTAEFRQTSSWGTGYQGTYTIRNQSRTRLDGWTVAFELPAGTAVSTYWDARLTREGGRHVFGHVGHNGTLAPGAATTFGWVASGSGLPARCVINSGGPCESGGDTTAPSVPVGIGFAAVGDTALTVRWTASSDDRDAVLTYEISIDGAAPVAVVGATSHRVTGLMPATGYAFRVRARDLAGNVSAYSPAVIGRTGDPGSPPRTMPTAPYVDMGAWPTPSLPALAAASGLRNFSLGFITATTCKAMWFNHFDPRTGWAERDIEALRAVGGEVKVSFGGAGGRELAQTCDSVDALFTEYDAVVTRYRLRYVDFDIEGSATTDPVSIARRSAALARLQEAHPGLRISLTLPVTPWGLTATGLSVVASARDAGVDVEVVNVMAMDYFMNIDYGDAALRAAEATFTQVKSLHPGRSDARLWGMIGVTPMLGENDDHQIYDQSDARQLVAFARSKGLGMISYWDVTRDRNACVGGHLSLCTNIPQAPYEFSRIVGAYTG